jgi:hypothetical protein
MSVIYDPTGNAQRLIPAQGGDLITDTRPAATLGALNAETVIGLAQEASATIDVRGTFVGTLIAEVSFDGTNYVQYPIFNPLTELYVVGITAAGQFVLDIPSGSRAVRIRMSAYTSGAATVVFRAANAPEFLYSKDITNSMITNTAGVGAAVTLTIPAAGAGLFNYLTMLQIVRFSTAVLTAAGTPVLVTTTGIIGTPTFSFPADVSSQGVNVEQKFEFSKPVKGTAANTAMTIVCPTTSLVIWRVNAAFYIGA